MLLEKLRKYAMKDPDQPPAGYQKLPIRYIIRLTPDGHFIGCEDTADSARKMRGTSHMAPHVKKSSGIRPKLLADNAEYTLGIARNDPNKPADPKKVAARHAAFKQVVDECAAATSEPAVKAVATFLAGALPSESELGADFDAAATITFRINAPGAPEGILPIRLPAVEAFWAARQAPSSDARATDAMPCIICGIVGPVLERHPIKIKGIPGAQPSGYDVISANEDAFLSYGLKASQIAPTCSSCAEAYGNGLNALLRSKTTSIWTKELAYAFWTDAAEESFGPIVIGMITEPQAHEGEVKALLRAHWSGLTSALALDPSRFYAASFGASGSRVVVKDWIDTTVGDAKTQLARYFALQEMVQWDGSESTPVPLVWLGNATIRSKDRKATPPPIVSKSLVRLALAGDQLPLDLLFLAVRRNRAEQKVTRERAMLIKMVMGSRKHQDREEFSRMTELDATNTNPAYVCGRLLATLDRIQYAALGTTNATIIDKYYGSASSAPASVFGPLLHGAQNHLGKLRGKRTPVYRALDSEVQEIMSALSTFPRTLTLEEQGLFALGFYHQRAAAQAQAAANKARREAAGQPVPGEDDAPADLAGA